MYLNFSCRKLEINLDSFGFHVSSRELLEGFLDYLEEVPVERFWDNVLQNCGYAVLEYGDGEWKILEKH